MTTLLDRLRATGCDREPFTPDHAKCICRLANEAADEIEHLRKVIEGIAMHGEIAIARGAINWVRKGSA